MKQVFIKQIDQYLETFGGSWKRKDVDYFASMYLQFCYYASNLYQSFKVVHITYDSDTLQFSYVHPKRGITGGAKIELNEMMYFILLPAIKDVAAKYGHTVQCASKQYQLAA